MGTLITVGSVNSGTNQTVAGIRTCRQGSIRIRTVKGVDIRCVGDVIFLCCFYQTPYHIIVIGAVSVLDTDGNLMLRTFQPFAYTAHINGKKLFHIIGNRAAGAVSGFLEYRDMLVNLTGGSNVFLFQIFCVS